MSIELERHDILTDLGRHTTMFLNHIDEYDILVLNFPASSVVPLGSLVLEDDIRLCSEMIRLRSTRLFVNVDAPYLCAQDLEKHHFSLSDT